MIDVGGDNKKNDYETIILFRIFFNFTLVIFYMIVAFFIINLHLHSSEVGQSSVFPSLQRFTITKTIFFCHLLIYLFI